MGQPYTTVCNWHKVHEEECWACRRFSEAIKQHLSSYVVPPESHPTVVASQTREWLGSIFPANKP